MMKRLLLSLFAVLLIPVQGWGQATVLQGGSWTPGRIPVYGSSGGTSQPVVQQSAPASGGAASISDLSLIARGTGTAPYAGSGSGYLGSPFCLYDGPTTGAYHQLCLSPNATGNFGLISYNAFNGAAAQSLKFNINGTAYDFPPVGGGNVTGPASATVNNLVTWNNIAGTAIADSGVSLTNVPSTGPSTGFQTARANYLSELNSGDLTNILWTANASGTQTSGIYSGNSSSYYGLSTRVSRSNDPPNVIWPTSAPTLAGSATLNFASTTGVVVGQYITGAAGIATGTTVLGKTATTVTMSAVATGTISTGTSINFIAGAEGGNRNVLSLYGLATDTVKPVNAILAIANCTSANTYCSGGNLIATSNAGSNPVKLVGMEVDQQFSAGDTAASGSAGFYLNTFNGSAHGGSGNGAAIQLGGVSGYWSNGLGCSGLTSTGSCLYVVGGSLSMGSILNASGATFTQNAIVVGNDTGANGQRVGFLDTTTINPSVIFMDSSDQFNIISGSGSILLKVGAQLAMTIGTNGGAFQTNATGGNQGGGTFNSRGLYVDGVAVLTQAKHIVGGNNAGTAIAAGQTRYMVTGTPVATENNAFNIASFNGTFSRLYVNSNVAPGGGESYAITLRVAGGSTSVTCTISGAATTCSDLVNTAAITSGQAWTMQVVASGAAASTQLSWGMQFANP